MMRRLLLAAIVFALQAASSLAHAQAASTVDLVMFYGRGCEYCAAMQQFLQTVEKEHPELRINSYEVYFDNENARLFSQLAAAYNTEISGVPTIFLGENVFVGFSQDIASDLQANIRTCIVQGCAAPLTRIFEAPRIATVTLPAVLLGAAVDAINPCEFAVLIILITTVLSAGGRRKALYSGLAFSASIFISYYLMGIGLYSAVEASGVTRSLYLAVGILAIVLGLFNLKDFFWYGKWMLMEVPLTWRPTLKKLIQGVTSVPGAFLTGFVVSLFLLPCTSGPYIVILGLLAETATRTNAFLWLLLYNAVFITPMVAITLAVYFGMTTAEKAEAWRTKHLKTLHLVAGLVLLILGTGILASLWAGLV